MSDKVPSLFEIWGIAGLAGIGLLLVARYKPWLLWAALPVAALWFGALVLEVHSPDVGPALLREQGRSYLVLADAAGAWLLGALIAGWVWRRRARRALRPLHQHTS